MIKIEGINLDGFGIFKSWQRTNIQSSFILIYGKNEAGKSTLFSFIRGMLAGFPSTRQQKENKYDPLNGGDHGGSLIISLGESYPGVKGRLRRKVKDNELEFTDSSNNKVEKYLTLFQELNRDNYKALFAFDLEELSSLSPLGDDALRERLFSTAVSGGDSLITSAMQELETRIKDLIRPKSKGELQKLDDELLDIRSKILTLSLECSQAEELVKNIAEEELKRAKLEERISELEKTQIESRENEKSKKHYIQLKELEEALEEFKGIRFPNSEDVRTFHDYIARESLLKEKLEVLSQSPDNLNQEIVNLQKRKESVELAQKNLDELDVHSQHLYLSGLKLAQEYRKKQISFFVIIALISGVFGSFVLGFNDIALGLFAFCFLVVTFFLKARSAESKLSLALDQHILDKERVEAKVKNVLKTIEAQEEGKSFDLINEGHNTNDVLDLIAMEHDRAIDRAEYQSLAIERDKDDRDEKLLQVRNQIKDFLQSFSLGSVELFEERVLQSQEYDSLLIRKKELLSILALDENIDLKSFFSSLENDSIEGAGNENFEGEKSKITNEFRESQDKISQMKVRLSHLASNDDLQRASLEEESIKKQFEDAYFDWKVAQFSKYLLGKSLSELVDGRYREVLSKGSELLFKSTNGRYKEILIRDDKSEINILDTNGSLKSLKSLSRGTIEQVYLSLRLGLALLYGNTFHPFPILLDDILVNFDLTRARSMLKVLKDVSEQHQILFFTCHEWIRSEIRELIPESEEILLS